MDAGDADGARSSSASSSMSPPRSRSGGSSTLPTRRRNSRSWRKSPSATIASRSRWVAATTRASTERGRLSPTRLISFSCRNRSRLAWACLDRSPISSRKTVPPLASSRTPIRSRSAPVNAPRTCPNSSEPMSDSVTLAQSKVTNDSWARGLRAWIRLATSSLPVPVSPLIRMGMSAAARRSSRSRACLSAGLSPTMPPITASAGRRRVPAGGRKLFAARAKSGPQGRIEVRRLEGELPTPGG